MYSCDHQVSKLYSGVCAQVSTPLSTSLYFQVQKYQLFSLLSCQQVSAPLSKSLALLTTSLYSVVHKSPLPLPQVSFILATSLRSHVQKTCLFVNTSPLTNLRSLIHKSPLSCPQLSVCLSTSLYYIVQKSSLYCSQVTIVG